MAFDARGSDGSDQQILIIGWRGNPYPGCACDVPSHLYRATAGSAR